MRKLSFAPISAVVSVLLLTSAAAAARPAPQPQTSLASPVTETATKDGKTEGQLYLDTLSPELRKELEKEGQVLLGEQAETEGSYGGLIKAVAIFTLPKNKVWELTTDPSKQVLFLPRLTESKTVERPENGELTKFQLKVMWQRIDFRVRHWFYPEIARIEWELDKEYDNDIAGQIGFWQFYQLDENTTIGEYGTRVDTGISVPKFIQDFFAKQDIPDAMTQFRKYVNSKGTYRRDD